MTVNGLTSTSSARDQLGPARVAELGRDGVLRIRELQRIPAAHQSRQRGGVTGSGLGEQVLRLLAGLLEVGTRNGDGHDLLLSNPGPQHGQERSAGHCDFVEVGSALPADRVRPRARRQPRPARPPANRV